MEAIREITTHAKAIREGREEVKPGMPANFTAASQAGDGVWQGDLGLEIVDAVPDGYVNVKRPKAADRKLVPGITEGSRHTLDSLDGVKLFRPEKWDEESLAGPCFVLTEERTVLHPTHGPVTIPAGFTVLCRYQREWDKIQQQERRARD
jgi:hypothetical protein